jgi:hypothetical protein
MSHRASAVERQTVIFSRVCPKSPPNGTEISEGDCRRWACAKVELYTLVDHIDASITSAAYDGGISMVTTKKILGGFYASFMLTSDHIEGSSTFSSAGRTRSLRSVRKCSWHSTTREDAQLAVPERHTGSSQRPASI